MAIAYMALINPGPRIATTAIASSRLGSASITSINRMIVVSTQQLASSEVAVRAGSLAAQLHQRVVGVIENMSYLPCPHCDERIDVFGSGGGRAVADELSRVAGFSVPLLGQVPIDMRLRESGDIGVPLVLADPASPAARELTMIADKLASRSRSLVGRPLGLTPA